MKFSKNNTMIFLGVGLTAKNCKIMMGILKRIYLELFPKYLSLHFIIQTIQVGLWRLIRAYRYLMRIITVLKEYCRHLLIMIIALVTCKE